MEADTGGGVAECGSARERARKRLAYFQNRYAAAACGRGGMRGNGFFFSFFFFLLNVGHFISWLLLVQSLFPPFLTKSIISSTLCCSVMRLQRDAQGTITYEQCRHTSGLLGAALAG